MRSFCNPLNLSYKYQHYKGGKGYAHREGADPTLVYFKGKYYLFASMSAGFWYSMDMLQWEFHENRDLYIYDYAPDVRQIGEYLYFSASRMSEKCPFVRTKDPLTDKFEVVSETINFYDPNIFCDDDGRVYFYWGCNKNKPLYCFEIDPETMVPKGDKVELLSAIPQERGYERLPEEVGEKKGLFDKVFGGVFIEGAFVNKYREKYYLQYASPSTSEHVYNNGVYTSEKPLGPYTPQQHNPFSSKPGGFITGAGHGSTIQDEHGNWWHAATMKISVNHKFERRIGLFPAGFDKDGVLFCNQNFADYPVIMPKSKFDLKEIKPRWMLLSFQKHASASSSLAGHGAGLALNEDIGTCWCAETSNPGEWYQVDLGEEYNVHAVQINFADHQVAKLKRSKNEYGGSIVDKRYIDTDSRLKTRYLLEASSDEQNWFVLEDKRCADTDFPHDYFEYVEGKRFRYIRITAAKLPYESRFALSGLRVFGKGNGTPPMPTTAKVKRIGDMDAVVSWKLLENTQGYNIRYGITPDKLYNSWLVYEQNTLILPMLCKGQEYYVAVDSFNENGITEGEIIKISTSVE